jgi:hypothetical protein
MKAVRHLLALVALALAATTASAQFVKGNEAVKVMPDGTKKVETPPPPQLDRFSRSPAPPQRGMQGRLADGRDARRACGVHRGLRETHHMPDIDLRL